MLTLRSRRNLTHLAGIAGPGTTLPVVAVNDLPVADALTSSGELRTLEDAAATLDVLRAAGIHGQASVQDVPVTGHEPSWQAVDGTVEVRVATDETTVVVRPDRNGRHAAAFTTGAAAWWLVDLDDPTTAADAVRELVAA